MNEDILKLEKQFIYLLLHHKKLVSDWVDSGLQVQHFCTEHQFIVTTILNSYDKNVLLTRKSFQSFLKQIKSPKEQVFQEVIFNNCLISKADENDFPLLFSQILESHLDRYSIDSIKRFKKDREEKGISFAIDKLTENLQSLTSSSCVGEEVIYKDFREFSEERLKYVDGIRSGEIKEPPRILCNIKEVDETMMTGFAKGTLTLFCGDSGGYKSAMMLNVALNIWEQGYDVLFVPLEMAEYRMYTRIWAREGRVNSEKIVNPITLSQEERDRLANVQKKWEGKENKFFVLYPPRGATVSSIGRHIERYFNVFKPQLVVIDYLDNLDPERSRPERHDIEISEMIIKLRRMGEERGFAVVSGAQLGRKALERIRDIGTRNDKSVIHSEDIRGAHTFVTDADNIYAQMVNPAQPDQILNLFVVKVREGKKTFPNGTFKASLEITPEIGLIKSQDDLEGIVGDDDDILNKIFEAEEDGSSSISFNEEETDNNNETSTDDILDGI